MNAIEAIEIGREALFVTIKISAPAMIVALIVGLSISLVQALTQIQEMTLSFVPKIIIIFISLILLLPFMLTVLTEFTQGLSDRIISLGI